MTCHGADIMLPKQVNAKLNLVEREIVTHKWGEGKKKTNLSDPIKVYINYSQVAEMLTHKD